MGKLSWLSVSCSAQAKYFPILYPADWTKFSLLMMCCLTDSQCSHRSCVKIVKLKMWANAQRDGSPAEYRWRPLFNAAVWLTPTTRVPCSNAAKTRKSLKLPGVPQTNETISAASGPKFTILCRHVGDIAA